MCLPFIDSILRWAWLVSFKISIFFIQLRQIIICGTILNYLTIICFFVKLSHMYGQFCVELSFKLTVTLYASCLLLLCLQMKSLWGYSTLSLSSYRLPNPAFQGLIYPKRLQKMYSNKSFVALEVACLWKSFKKAHFHYRFIWMKASGLVY